MTTSNAHKTCQADNSKKLRAARILLTQANDILSDLHFVYFTADQYKAVLEAKGHAMAGRKKLDAALDEDV